MKDSDATALAGKGKRQAPEDGSVKEADVTPNYGSQSYWDERYRKASKSQKIEGDETANTTANVDADPDAYHAWYFSYNELEPLLLPLIFGDDEMNDDVDDDDAEEHQQAQQLEESDAEENDQEDDGDASIKGKNEEINTLDDTKSNAASKTNGQNHGDAENKDSQSDDESDVKSEDEGEMEIIEMSDEDDDEEEERPNRPGLYKGGSISVVEIGCGDVPLGRDLLRGVEEYLKQRMENTTSIDQALKEVVCTDYSEAVIQQMKDESVKDKDNRILQYQVADGRKLPYNDESFDLILEKGTLDAMLSSNDPAGAQSCREILSECARVLKLGGAMMVVSHLNAHTGSGLDWLEKIVVPGLQRRTDKTKGNTSDNFAIEVHGNAPDAEDDAEAGPAVYIIHKNHAAPNAEVEEKSDKDEEQDGDDGWPTIPLRFCSY